MLFLIWILIVCAFMFLMLVLGFFNTTTNATFKIASSHQEAKRAEAQEEELEILRKIAIKHGIELPERKPKKSVASKMGSLLSMDDSGDEFRKQFRLSSKPLSEEEARLRKRLGIKTENRVLNEQERKIREQLGIMGNRRP